MEGRKNIEQEKDKGSGEVFDMMEGLHSGGRYLGKKRKFEKYGRTNKRIRTGEDSS